MNEVIAVLALGIMSKRDIKNRTVSLLFVALFFCAGIVMLCTDAGDSPASAPETVYSGGFFMAAGIIARLIPGGVALAASILTKKVGEGDSAALAATGMLLGFWKTLAALFIALFTCVVWGQTRKRGKEKKLPFIPFLFAGVLTVLCLQGAK